MNLKDSSFTVFDFETTGLYPYAGDRICEMGAVRIEPGLRKISKFHSLINPHRPISPAAFAVNGITVDMLEGQPVIEDILPSFMKFIGKSVLVAYNAGFDLGFLECALGSNKDALKGYYVIDALRLARLLFPGLRSYSLGSVAQVLEIRSEGEHRAMADAVTTQKLFLKELELLAMRGVEDVEDITYGRSKKTRIVAKAEDYKVGLIEQAIRQEKKLNIVYRSTWGGKVTARTITPKHIHKGYDRMYVVAHCHLKDAERNFRLDCIMDAKPYD